MRNSQLMLCTLAGVVYFGAATAGETTVAPAAGATPVVATDGVWTENTYSYTHLGFTTTYSCDGLADKLKLLLRTAGARKDVVANPIGCGGGYGRPSKFARVDLKFYTLKPAAMATPPAAGMPATVPGMWKAVQMSRLSPRDLGGGDCELVDDFSKVLLPMFATRAVESNLTCVPHQASGSLRLSFESFVAVPAPQAAKKS